MSSRLKPGLARVAYNIGIVLFIDDNDANREVEFLLERGALLIVLDIDPCSLDLYDADYCNDQYSGLVPVVIPSEDGAFLCALCSNWFDHKYIAMVEP